MSENSSPVLVQQDGAVAIVTMNRPDRHNSLNIDIKVALREALEAVAADDTVRAVILTGSGKSFCVGQDLGEHAAALEHDAATALNTVVEHYNPIVLALTTMPKPVVAAVNGTCVGAGLGFALACDLRVLSSSATLGTAFSAIGLTCDSGLSASLVRAVGEARTKEMVLLGRPFSAEDAVRWGITADVVEAADVLRAATDLAQKLADGPTAAFAASKRVINEASGLTFAESLDLEGREQIALGPTKDHQGAVAAFLAKQKPTFIGR